MVSSHIPGLHLPSLLNKRWHWRKLASTKKKQRTRVKEVIRNLVIPPAPLIVTITRIGPGRLDDDNLQGACKAVRDGIADSIGVDDGSDIYTWVYRQEVGPYGVTVEVKSRSTSSG